MEIPAEQPIGSGTLDDKRVHAYLEHHLSGAMTAEGVARRLRSDADASEAVRAFSARFLEELRDDADYLRTALARVPSHKGILERGVGVAGSVAMQVRDALPLPNRPKPFDEIELLAVGVWGKGLLWRTLRQLDSISGRFSDLPFPMLIQRALAQERALVGLRDDLLEFTFIEAR